METRKYNVNGQLVELDEILDGNRMAQEIIKNSPEIVRWFTGRTSRMKGDYLDSVQADYLQGFDDGGVEYYWVCDESGAGGEVITGPDGRRYVDLVVCRLDADTGEEYTD